MSRRSTQLCVSGGGMSQSGDPEAPNAWLLDPASNLVRFLGNEIVVAGLTRTALVLTEASPWLFKAAAKGLPPNNRSGLVAIGRLMKQAQSDSVFASSEMQTGFKTVSSHSAIAIWAAIETAIEQTLLNHIRKLPNSKELMAASAPALKADKIQTGTEGDIRKALRRWEASLDDGDAVERALRMLAAMQVDLVIPEEIRRKLTEMGEVRNVLMHRGGIADEWTVSKCPWLGISPGDELVIDDAKLETFIDAAHRFAVCLIGACAKSPYAYKAPTT